MGLGRCGGDVVEELADVKSREEGWGTAERVRRWKGETEGSHAETRRRGEGTSGAGAKS